MSFIVEGDLLVVPPNAPLPKICLRCGTKKALTYQPITFAVQSSATTGGAVGGAVGATLAALGRQNTIFYLIGGVVVLGVIGLVIHQAQRADKVEVDGPFCATCEDELRAIRVQWRAMGGVILALVAISLVTATMTLWLFAAAGLVAALLMSVWVGTRKYPQNFLRADRVVEGFVWIQGVGPNALKRLAKRAEARVARAQPASEPAFSPVEDS